MKKGGGIASAARNEILAGEAYFIDEETLVKVELRLLPTPCMAAMAATAISAAIRPYSMAVAPLLLLISLRTIFIFPVSSISTCARRSRHCPIASSGARGEVSPRPVDNSLIRSAVIAASPLISFRKNSPSGIFDLAGDIGPQTGRTVAHGDHPDDHGEEDQRQDQPIFDRGRGPLILRDFKQMSHRSGPWH